MQCRHRLRDHGIRPIDTHEAQFAQALRDCLRILTHIRRQGHDRIARSLTNSLDGRCRITHQRWLCLWQTRVAALRPSPAASQNHERRVPHRRFHADQVRKEHAVPPGPSPRAAAPRSLRPEERSHVSVRCPQRTNLCQSGLSRRQRAVRRDSQPSESSNS